MFVGSAALAVAVAAPLESAGAVTIEWNAPPSCPSPAAVDDGLRGWLRAPIGDPIRVRADVELREQGYVADLVVDTPWGSSRRHIEASECSAIANTTVLIAAIAADPLAIAMREPLPSMRSAPPPPPRPIASAPEGMPASEPTQVVAPIDPGPPVRPRERRRPLGLVRIEGAFGLGIVPQPSGGVGGALGVQWRHLEIGVASMWWPPRTTARIASGAAARVGLVAVGPYACGFLGSRAWSVGLCGSVEPGVMTGQGRDVAGPDRRSVAWVGLGLGPRVRWSPRRRVGLVAGIEGVAVVHRARFVIANEGEVYRAGIAGFRLRLGIEVRWP
jgi:hypothetical protein